nr:terpene synthase 10-like [Ipomoea batatas]
MAAIVSILSTFTCKLPYSLPTSHTSSFRMCYHTTSTTTTRRSGNYGPSTWDFTYIQSLNTTSYTAERFVTRRDELKERVKDMLKNEEMKELEKMEMIDELQRLGCSYHFEDEIKAALMDIYMKNSDSYKSSSEEKDLYATALEFRLLRQNGYNISQDVFNVFMDRERSSFKANLCEDTKGLLNLYEASFLSMEGETTLKLAKDFSTKHMKYVAHDQNLGDQNLLASVQHALELPLHWRMPRLEAKCFIDSYKLKATWNPILLEFAKLDFNLVQAVHQEDLKFVSRVVENFIWSVGLYFNPMYANWRRMNAKINCFICTIDDIYDVYGTMDELQLFTDTIERWDDVSEIGHLPEYMKFCYVALHNFVNEVAFDVLKEHNIFIVHYLRKANEMKRGDVPKAIQCYMNENRVYSNADARDFIDFEISETWKKMNKVRIEGSPFSEAFIEVAMNIARMAQCMYQHGDGHGIKNLETQTRIQTLLFQPIPLI